MILSDLAVQNRTSVFVLAAVVALMGVLSYRALPLESAPDVKIPNVFVTTVYRGVAPEDVEKSVTIPIEKKLKGLSGVKKISSISSEGESSINVEFETDVVIEDALVKVKDKVDLAKNDLPTDLEDDPSVFEVNIAEMPILLLSLSGPCGLQQLTHLADRLKEDIEGVRGVLEVEVVGGAKREIQIEVDPDRMALYNVPLNQLELIVKGENSNVSGGSVRTVEGRYQLRVPGEFHTVEDVEGLIIGERGGQPVYLRDLARVVDGTEERQSYSRLDGEESVSLYVKKRSGANIVTIVDEIDQAVGRAQATWPQGTRAVKMWDRAREIRNMVTDLENNMATGLILVVLVVWIGMGLRNALMVSVSIPMSMLLTFIVLQMLGITLNMVVLFSLTLAVGMLVDNAIVIIENIYRFQGQGVPPDEAAKWATHEVAWPVIGATFTTVVAFVPLLWWTGVMGGFMIFLPKTVIISLLSCLLVGLVVNPALAAVFVRAPYQGPPVSAQDVLTCGEHPNLRGGGPVLGAYRRLLRSALRYRLAVLALGLVLLVGSIQVWLLRVGLRTGQEFFPSVDPTNVQVDVRSPEGADLSYSDRLVREAAIRVASGQATGVATGAAPRRYEDALTPRTARDVKGRAYQTFSALPDVKHVSEKSLAKPGDEFFGQGASGNQVGLQFLDIDGRTVSSKVTLRALEGLVDGLAGAEVSVIEQEHGPPTGSAINVEISGDDFATLGQVAEGVKALVAQVPHVRNVRSDFRQGSPTVRIALDRTRAAILGLSTQRVGLVVKTAFNGLEVSTWREGSDDYKIMLRFPEASRRLVDTLRKLYLPSERAGLVPLTTVARIQYAGGLGKITRRDHKRVVTVKADVDQTKTTGIVARVEAERLMEQLGVPPGIGLRFTGENEFQQESQDFLGWAFGVGLLLIAAVLVIQFDSVLLPLIIMTTVILSLSGAFAGMAFHRVPFGIIMSTLGIISLAGVVVNNAIVLIDYTEQLVRRGHTTEDAIVAAGVTRLRPVLLTAVTTVLGLVPIVGGVAYDFSTWQVQWASESTQMWFAFGVGVSWGLTVATGLTLVVVPCTYSVVVSARARVRVALGRAWAALRPRSHAL